MFMTRPYIICHMVTSIYKTFPKGGQDYVY